MELNFGYSNCILRCRQVNIDSHYLLLLILNLMIKNNNFIFRKEVIPKFVISKIIIIPFDKYSSSFLFDV